MSEKKRSWFSLSYHVETEMSASPSEVWALLANVGGYAAWNSTITRASGTDSLGEKLELEVPLAPGRVFRPKVVAVDPGRQMVWSDGFAPMFRGTRTYRLEPTPRGTRFAMTEVFTGIMLPLIAPSLPDFSQAFDQYAADLKAASESRAG